MMRFENLYSRRQSRSQEMRAELVPPTSSFVCWTQNTNETCEWMQQLIEANTLMEHPERYLPKLSYPTNYGVIYRIYGAWNFKQINL